METVLNLVTTNHKLQADRYEICDSGSNLSITNPFQQQLEHLRTLETITTENGSQERTSKEPDAEKARNVRVFIRKIAKTNRKHSE